MQEASGARTSSICLGAVVGSLAPLGCMRGFRLAGDSSGPGSVWIRRRMPVGEMWVSRCSAGCACLNRLWPSGRREVTRLVVCFEAWIVFIEPALPPVGQAELAKGGSDPVMLGVAEHHWVDRAAGHDGPLEGGVPPPQ